MTALADARTWFGASTNRRILGAAATVAVLSLVVRAASLGKDLAVAYRFGTGDSLDAFLIALLLPAFAINVVASSLNSAFVPVFIELREREGAASADRLFRSVLAVSLGILAVRPAVVGGRIAALDSPRGRAAMDVLLALDRWSARALRTRATDRFELQSLEAGVDS